MSPAAATTGYVGCGAAVPLVSTTRTGAVAPASRERNVRALEDPVVRATSSACPERTREVTSTDAHCFSQVAPVRATMAPGDGLVDQVVDSDQSPVTGRTATPVSEMLRL